MPAPVYSMSWRLISLFLFSSPLLSSNLLSSPSHTSLAVLHDLVQKLNLSSGDAQPLSRGGDNWNRADSTIYDALGTLYLSGQVKASSLLLLCLLLCSPFTHLLPIAPQPSWHELGPDLARVTSLSSAGWGPVGRYRVRAAGAGGPCPLPSALSARCPLLSALSSFIHPLSPLLSRLSLSHPSHPSLSPVPQSLDGWCRWWRRPARLSRWFYRPRYSRLSHPQKRSFVAGRWRLTGNLGCFSTIYGWLEGFWARTRSPATAGCWPRR